MGPLTGLKVLDLTGMVSGPVAAMMLADQGAEVIKVEPLTGELVRHMAAPHNGVNPVFFSCNRGKKSIALDLKTEEGKKILLRLASEADVFMQNFRPGAIDRMGFGEEVIRKLNPKIIYVSISGFGNRGPYANSRVYDPVIQALSGATDIQADRDTGRPKMFRIIIADKVTALTAAQAVAAALYAREKHGTAQHIELSMLDCMISFFWPEGMAGIVFAENEIDVRKLQGSQDLIYKAKDKYITAGAVSDAEWQGMCKALNREDLVDDERFASPAGRVANAQIRKEITGEEIAKWNSSEILERLQAEGVPSAPLLDRMELLDNEQILANESIQRINIDGFGEVRQARPAARFSKTPTKLSRPAPKLGEHTHEVLSDIGINETERKNLLDKKIIVSS
ncbi:MAG: CoA transferase [Pseudomonadota bacterium]|jgi:crotonobetainyl-CoA:carnitine CoA-transferase CaiB-like acyl-CoA transferase|nr:CoA transferase [Pseudomonadota bacterium]MEC7465376.1 CoA transferase [Pseudomonadota bacterium]MEC7786874.1 CoA transferase [Pseudomonadota bacterium]MEC8108391.1 CoA transferase [Pseudomonadota bacterium]MEC8169400.1 CoA transferase [Pseudomonadota bacterium]|tara:strand:+ start:4098 stop:5282 length:1185 start_codon:yes stop_codon:yes gene_type:complete